jgi:peptide chain release factor subunit 1
MDTTTERENTLIENFKAQKVIKSLEKYRGSGTSLISLIMPPDTPLGKVNSMLTIELGTASNIKSRITRQAVESAITSTQQKLKLYNRLPPNGLVIYCGHVTTEEKGEKKVTIAIEPPKRVPFYDYECGSSFKTKVLFDMLGQDEAYGFIVVCGDGCLLGLLKGQTKTILPQSFTTQLPKKHNKGGQSSVRFARLRVEAIHNYIRKVSEAVTSAFITNDVPNIKGLIVSGVADLKTELTRSDLFEPRLRPKIMKIVDVAYGGANGFDQAIDLSKELISDSKIIEQKKVIASFFELIAKSSNDEPRYCFGQRDVLYALKLGAVASLIIWDCLPLPPPEDAKNAYETFLEWIVDNYKSFGTRIELITDSTSESSQFCKGFGGLGAILRYPVVFDTDEIDDSANVPDVDFL